MSEKNTKATETVEIDPGMSVMPEGPGLMDVPTVIPELDSVLAAMPTALPAYQTTTWKNKPSTETPVDAAVMTRVEQRLVDLTNAVNGLRDSVSRKLEPASETFVPRSMSEIDVTYVGPVALNGCSDAPAEFYKWGYLISFVGTGGGFQIYVPDATSGTLFFRSKFGSSSYRDWTKLIGSSIQ